MATTLASCMLLIVFLIGCTLAQDSCETDPFNTECSSYIPPTSVLANLTTYACAPGTGMPTMPGCYVNQLCNDQKYSLSNDKFCAPFSVYMDVCTSMKGMMGECDLLASMCPNTSSVIDVCYSPRLTLPSSRLVQNLSLTMCDSMPMPACSQCSPSSTNCNYFKMYSELCISMPGMNECAAWKSMCSDIPTWPLCSSSNPYNPIPEMRMFFHTGITDYVLFKSWVPTSHGAYGWTWVVVFLFTILYEVVKLIRTRLEKRWSDSLHEGYTNMNVNSSSRFMALFAGEVPFRPSVDFSRAIIHTIEVAWGFLVMLVVMTFNVGLCLAVLAGSFVGMLFIGRFVIYVPKASCH